MREPANDNKRLMGRVEAAAYCDLKPSAFSQWVAIGRLPRPLLGTHKWDKVALDARLDELSGIKLEAANEDPFLKWEKEIDANIAKGRR
ncbi:hypothetical protein [Rhizobium leucaenae]|uniref:hypothetical protein n=1 Tax=Rhizobium leucaenae TaxID=29450 RepID=UPI001FD9CA11|nr:hypothetical protein [Rhizobium leucaenae]